MKALKSHSICAAPSLPEHFHSGNTKNLRCYRVLQGVESAGWTLTVLPDRLEPDYGMANDRLLQIVFGGAQQLRVKCLRRGGRYGGAADILFD